MTWTTAAAHKQLKVAEEGRAVSTRAHTRTVVFLHCCRLLLPLSRCVDACESDAQLNQPFVSCAFFLQLNDVSLGSRIETREREGGFTHGGD